MTTDKQQDKAKALLQPLLDLFSGADGGIAFARLRHDILPEFIRQAEEEGTKSGVAAAEIVTIFKQMSALSQAILDKKI